MAKALHEHIKAIKARRGWTIVGDLLAAEVERLAEAWKAMPPKHALAFLPFIPVRLATLIEVCARDSFKALVDAKQAYATAAEKTLKSTKFDHELVLGLIGQSLSLGDIAARVISTNNAEQIISSFETLEPDFKRKLTSVHTRWTDDRASWPLPAIIGNYASMMAVLASIFEARHIVVHELPDELPFDASDIPRYLSATKEFVDAISWLIVELVHDSVPRTQLAMDAEAADAVALLQTELATALRKLATVRDTPVLLERSQQAWEAYAIAQAELRAATVLGGSMYSMVYNSEMADCLRQRIDLLNEMSGREEGNV
jgi:uncharacterized protein YecT (DUF1311 family)